LIKKVTLVFKVNRQKMMSSRSKAGDCPRDQGNDAKRENSKKIVYEKQVVFWAKKYADKAKAERGELVKKAFALVANPSNTVGPLRTGLLNMLKT
jgi:hypothetical protein